MKTMIGSALAVLVAASADTASTQSMPIDAAWTWSRDFTNVPLPIGGVFLGMTTGDLGLGEELFVCGDFWGSPGESTWVARWSPNLGWRPMGGPHWLNDWVQAVAFYDDGSGPAVYAGGAFDNLGNGLSRWIPGVGWQALTSPTSSFGCVMGGFVYAFAVHDDGTGPGLYIGGRMNGVACGSSNVTVSKNVVRYDSSGFHSLAGGVDQSLGVVRAFASHDDGTGPALYVGGEFASIGGAVVNGVARWSGTAWSAVGSPPGGAGNQVESLAVYDDGSGSALFATMYSPSTGSLFAKWSAGQWVVLSSPGGAARLFAFDDGRGPALFCLSFAASRGVSRWDGSTWSGLGQGLYDGWIEAMTDYDAGRGPELHVCGHFQQAGGGIAALNIASWRSARGPIDLVCLGDQTYAPCPCSGFGAPLHGCPNSFDANGGALTPSGATSDDSLVFTATSLPPNTLGVLFQGDQFLSNGVAFLPGSPLPHFGDGLRCVGGNLKRLFTKSAAAGQIVAPDVGDPSVRARAASLGDPLGAGAERYYQIWYRDPHPTFCVVAATNNTTNGVRVVW